MNKLMPPLECCNKPLKERYDDLDCADINYDYTKCTPNKKSKESLNFYQERMSQYQQTKDEARGGPFTLGKKKKRGSRKRRSSKRKCRK